MLFEQNKGKMPKFVLALLKVYLKNVNLPVIHKKILMTIVW